MDSNFNVSKYDVAHNSLVSLSDSYANHIKTYISFKHLDSAQTVYFKAFITNLVDTFSADWTRESIYGRVDPVPIYAQTQRSISLNLTIPADSIGEAYENLARVQKLVQFLYPSYTTGDDGSRTITKSPLIRLKAMNLVSKGESIDKEIQRALRMADSALAFSRAETDPDPMPRPDYYKNYTSDASPDNGLLGFINGLTVMHNLAKQIDISLTFMPVHEENPSAAGGIFPYNVELQSDVKVDGWYGTSLSGSTAAEANDQAATQGVLNNVK